MSWQEIKGQHSAINFLKNILIEKKLSGAYLFAGPAGVGKRLVAKNFAKVLNCEQRLENCDCCDRCPACVKIDNFNHPDVNWIETAKSAQKISISQIRNIKKDIALKPYEGKTKIYLILKAELLSEEASNCLLKTLEEPPADALLILTASGKLLPTIVSRCRIVKFSSLPVDEVKEILKSRFNLSDQAASFLANLCEGKLGKAMESKDRDILNEKNEIIDRLLTLSPKGQACGAGFEFSTAQSREEIEEMLKIILGWYRDVLISKCKARDLPLINLDRREEILNLADRMSFEKLTGAIRTISDTCTFIRQNVNPKLALEVMTEELADV